MCSGITLRKSNFVRGPAADKQEFIVHYADGAARQLLQARQSAELQLTLSDMEEQETLLLIFHE